MTERAKVYSSIRVQESTLARLRAFGATLGAGVAEAGMGAAVQAHGLVTLDQVVQELLDRRDEHLVRAARSRTAQREKRRAAARDEKEGGK
jgi:hypothetical protein